MRRLLTAAMLVMASCGSTLSMERDWAAPLGQRVPLRTVATVFVSDDTSIRRASEDLLARELARQGVHAVPAYTVLADDVRRAPEGVFAQLQAAGFDGVVVVRVLSKRRELDTPPGAYEVAWDEAWHTDFTGDLVPDTVIRIETTAYALEAANPLLWSGMARSVNPENLRDLIDDLTRVVSREMRAHGVLAG